MSNFSQSELNSIREMVVCHQTASAKLAGYSQQCQDAQIKQMFSQASNQAQTAAQNLLQML